MAKQGKSLKMISKLFFYLGWLIHCKVGGKRVPLNSSIILTDKCNLNCKHCTVSGLGYRDLTFNEVCSDLKRLYNKGSRVLVITGGEPFVWRDQEAGLEEVVLFAKRLGFFRIVICTNGTFPLKSSADYLWVNLDGIPSEHDELRGAIYEQVISNIRNGEHGSIFINFTLSRINIKNLEGAAEKLINTPNVKGLLLHLFTPYLGSDRALLLDEEERRNVVERIYKIKKRYPFKITNTFDGIKLLKTNNWRRPIWASEVINRGEVGPCCCRRGIYDEEVCKQCGCTPAIETYVVQEMKPLALLESLRFL
jgi:Fe-coproporphyrin III synthase